MANLLFFCVFYMGGDFMKGFIRKYRLYIWLSFIVACVVIGFIGFIVWWSRFDIIYEVMALIMSIIVWFVSGNGKRGITNSENKKSKQTQENMKIAKEPVEKEINRVIKK
ncbi:hypothetical protein ACT7DE_19065 [Bacillus paranthracis]